DRDEAGTDTIHPACALQVLVGLGILRLNLLCDLPPLLCLLVGGDLAQLRVLALLACPLLGVANRLDLFPTEGLRVVQGRAVLHGGGALCRAERPAQPVPVEQPLSRGVARADRRWTVVNASIWVPEHALPGWR